MKTAIYPGSFSPWHQGHTYVLSKSLEIFERVIIACGTNPEKTSSDILELESIPMIYRNRCEIIPYKGLLSDALRRSMYHNVTAVIKGLRNSQDFEYEKNQQYWNEDLGINLPTFYVITDRKFTHISSNAIRIIEDFKKL